MNQQTKGRRAAIRARERLTQETTRQDVRLRVRNNKERQRRNHGDGELFLLLLTVAAATTILKQSHAFVVLSAEKKNYVVNEYVIVFGVGSSSSVPGLVVSLITSTSFSFMIKPGTYFGLK